MSNTSTSSPREAALAYAAAGIPVFPCKPDKRPFVSGGFKSATNDPAKIAEHWARWPDALIGVPTGEATGLFVLDLDIDRDTGEFTGEASLAAAGLSGVLDGAIEVCTPSGGRHYYFRQMGELRNSVGRLGRKIDVRGEGGYVCVPGSGGYRWAGRTIFEAEVPEVPKALREALAKPAPEPSAPPVGNVVSFPMQILARQLAAVPAPGGAASAWTEQALNAEIGRVMSAAQGTRNHTLNRSSFSIGQIVAGGALDHAAAEAALARAGRAIGLADDEIAATIASGFAAGAAGPRTAPERVQDRVQASPFAAPPPDLLASRKAALAAKIVRANDVRPLLSSPNLVKGWLDRGAMSVVYGESNVGKSFFALSIAHHVARGERWAGCRVVGGPVFYIASEGGRSFVNRVAALDGPSERLVVIPVSVDLCGSALDAEAIAALIRDEAEVHGEPALLVIDTLARSMGQGDENTAPDMGAFVRNVDVIREKTSAHVMVIHHSGKDRAKGARGHSSLRAATDTEIELTGEGEIVVAEAKKQRDMANGRRFAYRLAEVELGHDQDGDAVTTCRVEPCEVPEKTAAVTLSPEQRRVLEALRQFVDDHGVPNPGGIIDAMSAVIEANSSVSGFAMSPTVAKAIRKLRDADGRTLDVISGVGRSATMESLPVATSTALPAFAAGSLGLIAGDFAEAMVGLWGTLEILVNPYAEAQYSRGAVAIRAILSADVQVRHAKSFAKLTVKA